MPCDSIYGKSTKKEMVIRSNDNQLIDLEDKKKALKKKGKSYTKYKPKKSIKKTKKTLSKIGKGFEKTRKKRAKKYAKSIFGKI